MKSFVQAMVVVLIFSFLGGCQKERESGSGDLLLSFSADTIAFDTIFNSIVTPTKNLRVYNSTSDKLTISSVRLGGGESSGFKINVNGEASSEVLNVEIPPHDSIFIFVQATLSKFGNNVLMLAEDSILFRIDNKEQKVRLLACGQDIKLVKSEMVRTTTWTKGKPYLVYNYAFVDSSQTLTIEPGTTIYFHKNAGLFIKGTLIVNGTLEEPVIFKGDRLESGYVNLADQWSGITLLSGSHNNVINYAVIKNGNIGLLVGTIENKGFASLELTNSRIENMSWAGIWAMKSKIFAYNCIIANIGFYNTALLLGGDYQFYHTTFSNNSTNAFSLFPQKETLTISNYLVNSLNGTKYTGDLTQATFGNCIIGGLKTNNLNLSMNNQGKSNYLFDHCLIQLADTFKLQNPDRFIDLIRNVSPRFVNPTKGLYELDTLSVAKDRGKAGYAKMFPLDMKRADRNYDSGPDLGAFERLERKK